MAGGSTADHENLVRALERLEIADARAKVEMVPSVQGLAMRRLIQLRSAALPCGWDEMAESLEDFAKRRVETFLRMQGPTHSHQPEVGVPGEPARYGLNRFGMWTTPFAYLHTGIAMATWLGEAPRGSAVWWNQKAKAYAAAPINEVMGFWVHMTDWEVEGLYPAAEGLCRVIIR